MTIEHKNETLVYVASLLVYMFVPYVTSLLTNSIELILAMKLLAVGAFLFYFKKHFSFKLKFDLLAILAGILIAVLWVVLDPLYMKPVAEVPVYGTLAIIMKFMTGILLAPLIEEFFTRFFLHRYLEAKKWLTIPQGTFSLMPFVITTLFFGLSHHQWLAGIITGILLNLLWYKRKDMNSIVLAHAVANAVLGVLVITLGLYQFW